MCYFSEISSTFRTWNESVLCELKCFHWNSLIAWRIFAVCAFFFLLSLLLLQRVEVSNSHFKCRIHVCIVNTRLTLFQSASTYFTHALCLSSFSPKKLSVKFNFSIHFLGLHIFRIQKFSFDKSVWKSFKISDLRQRTESQKKTLRQEKVFTRHRWNREKFRCEIAFEDTMRCIAMQCNAIPFYGIKLMNKDSFKLQTIFMFILKMLLKHNILSSSEWFLAKTFEFQLLFTSLKMFNVYDLFMNTNLRNFGERSLIHEAYETLIGLFFPFLHPIIKWTSSKFRVGLWRI